MAVVVAAVAVSAGVVLTHRTTRAGRWWAEFGSSDAAVVNQDNQVIAGVLSSGPGLSAVALHFDCQIGARDLARILSHAPSPNRGFRRAYRTALELDARAFDACVSMTASPSASSPAAAIAAVRHDLHRFDGAIPTVNARGGRIGYGSVFAPAR